MIDIPRTFVITGAGSGIGLATRRLAHSHGHRVIGIDLKNADVIADLSTPEGRRGALDAVREISSGDIDVVVANAGSAAADPKTISINFFGATKIISGLHEILTKSATPRVVATSSMASFGNVDDHLVDLMLAGDERRAVERAYELIVEDGQRKQLIYGSTKRALSRWIRRECIKDEWAKIGIPMNAVGPGIVRTPMVESMIATEAGRQALAKSVPMPLNGYLEAEDIAEVILWLASLANTHMTGQTIYVDGGADAVLRGDDIWKSG